MRSPHGVVNSARLAENLRLHARWRPTRRSYTPGLMQSRWFEHLEFSIYRLGAFVLLNVLDDPAWLALIFC